MSARMESASRRSPRFGSSRRETAREVRTAPGSVRRETGTYAERFYREHPEELLDIRDPETKYRCLATAHALDPSEKFQLLFQKKAAASLVFGEDSIEELRVQVEIGDFYAKQHRLESSLRHFQEAQKHPRFGELDEDEQTLVYVGVGEGLVGVRNDVRGSEAAQKKAEAIDAESRYICSRRAIARARLEAAKNNLTESLRLYSDALESLAVEDGEDLDIIGAKLLIEMADIAERNGDSEAAGEHIKRAHATFVRKGMPGSADLIRHRLPNAGTSDDESTSSTG